MRKFITTALLIALSLQTAPLKASEGRKLCSLITVEGACSQLMQDNKELLCKGVLMNTEYDDGTTGFYFIEKEPGDKILTFSGFGSDQQTILPDTSVLQPIKRVIQKDGNLAVSGQCIFENPYAGPANIECEAVASNGAWFIGHFLSDGSKPKRKDFCQNN